MTNERAIEWDRDFCPECGEEAEQYRKARHCGACVLTWDGAYVGYDQDIDIRLQHDDEDEDIAERQTKERKAR